MLSESSPDLTHSCLEMINFTYSSRNDLLDQTLENPLEEWLTDGSSFVQNVQQKVRCAVVSFYDTIEAQPLPPLTLAQKAEIMALT